MSKNVRGDTMENDKKIVSFDDVNYEVIKEDSIGGKYFYLAGPGQDDKHEYITGTVVKTLADAGREYYTLDRASANYIEVAEYYYGNLVRELQQVRVNEPKDIPVMTISSADCSSIYDYSSLIVKLVVLKSDALYPEFQNSIHQLYLAKGGFGCNPTGSGNAIYAENLYTGEHSRIERYEVLGVIKQEKLPKWAKQKLKEKTKGEER